MYRVDTLNGEHNEVYGYDPVSGRLSTVTDMIPEPDVVHSFVWNPEGTLARWSEPNAGYDRVFGYDEEGRLVRIERDYGNGNKQVAYEYGYNSDGVKVWKKDHLSGQEYRYLCRIGCGGTPMRVYNRAIGNESWTSVEDYLQTPTLNAYHNRYGSYMDYWWRAGHWLGEFPSGEGQMVYRDAFGATPELVLLDIPPPLYLQFGEDDFQMQGLLWIVIIGIGIGLSAFAAWDCIRTINKTREEVEQWEEEMHYDHGGGADKLVHCVAACLITLRAGRPCGDLAARATEREGTNPFGKFVGDPDDEKANFAGVKCGGLITALTGSSAPVYELPYNPHKGPWAPTGNEWLDCQMCCRQAGYRGVIKWH